MLSPVKLTALFNIRLTISISGPISNTCITVQPASGQYNCPHTKNSANIKSLI